MNRLVPAFLLVAVAVGGVAWFLREPPAEKPVAPTQPPGAPEKPPMPTPGAATAVVLPIPSTKDVPAERLLRFPNGETAAPLNGIENPATCVWGDTPWSPIVRRELNNGIEWYVHADGTYTTTTTIWRSDTKRQEPVTFCMHPTTPATLGADDSGATGGTPKK